MIAFHYPPYEGGSGVHRTLKFSRYLPEHGWQPIVLSAHPRAYPQLGAEQLQEIPSEAIVERAFALDTARHLSVRGFHFRWMALPDRWVSWWIGAVAAGLKVVRRHRPEILWSTYPIATAHLIGFTLQRITGLPWVADFRDSMTEENYPRDLWSRRSYQWIEKRVVEHSSRLIFTAASTRRMYLNRYSDLTPERCFVLPNGYDEQDFMDLAISRIPQNLNGRPIRLLHAGLIYTDDRDPTAFFKALSKLKQQGKIGSQNLKIDLRASGSETYYTQMIGELRIDDVVHLLPPLSHRKALEDCAQADALILFQAASCNHQIPAKVYEYLRLEKPILALTPQEGDTAALLNETGGATIVDLADEETMISSLPKFVSDVRHATHPLPDSEHIRRYARSHHALELARCMSELANARGVD